MRAARWDLGNVEHDRHWRNPLKFGVV